MPMGALVSSIALRQYEAALTEIRASITISPPTPRTNLERDTYAMEAAMGDSYRNKQLGAAIAAYRTALDHAPDDSAENTRYAEILQQLEIESIERCTMNRVLQWLACLLDLGGIFMLFTAVTFGRNLQIAVSQSTDVAATPRPPTTVPTTATLALDFDLNAVTDEDAIGELEFCRWRARERGCIASL
ncbi:MAG: hypothetical protein R2867_08565 [Caldilineaceae bacterium]